MISKKNVGRLLLIAVAFVAVVVASEAVNYLYDDPSVETLPEPATILRMDARLLQAAEGSGGDKLFPVPVEEISTVLKVLQPAEREYHPPKWEVMGYLDIVTLEEKKVLVTLYRTGADKGAYTVGTHSRRPCYRAGTDKEIEEAVRKAYQKTIPVQPSPQRDG